MIWIMMGLGADKKLSLNRDLGTHWVGGFFTKEICDEVEVRVGSSVCDEFGRGGL